MLLLCFLLERQKNSFHRLKHWSLLLLVYNTLKKMFFLLYFQMIKQIIYWLVWLAISDLYLFHWVDLLNPDFNCPKKLLSSSVDKVTAATYNFMSVILNVVFVGLLTAAIAGFPPWAGTASLVALLVNTPFSDHLRKCLFHS